MPDEIVANDGVGATPGLTAQQCTFLKVWVLLCTNRDFMNSAGTDPAKIANAMGVTGADLPLAMQVIGKVMENTSLDTPNTRRAAAATMRGDFQSFSVAMGWSGRGGHPTIADLNAALVPKPPAPTAP